MTEKEKLIARLNELGTQLNREVSTSGTIQELTMRIAELEEELGDDTDTNGIVISGVVDGGGADEGTVSTMPPVGSDSVALTDSGTDLVTVETLATLHVEAFHAHRDERVSIVESGVIIRVSDEEADLLVAQGLVREV